MRSPSRARFAVAILAVTGALLTGACGSGGGTALPQLADEPVSEVTVSPEVSLPAVDPAAATTETASGDTDAPDSDAAGSDAAGATTSGATTSGATTPGATTPHRSVSGRRVPRTTPARPARTTPARPTTTRNTTTRNTTTRNTTTRNTTFPVTRTASGSSPTGETVRSAKKGAAIWAFDGVDRAFADSGASWYYTWSPSAAGLGGLQGEFVPMIWGPGSVTPSALAQAKAAGGTLLGFNEPDLTGQANMSVEQALALWPQLQATGLRLASPVVASGGATPGGWLDRFMSGAAARGYRVDVIALHWYGGDFSAPNATAQLRQYLTAVHDRYHKPIWLTEYALMRFGPTQTPSAADQAAFVTSSTAMLESLAFVERYAWFSFPTPKEGGLGTGLYQPGGTATAMGAAYRRAG